MPTAQEIYANTIRDLPPEEQLRLAALILNQLTQTAARTGWDVHDSWSEQDIQDLTTFSMKYADTQYTKDEDVV
jgi:hypothetical protein